MNKRFSVSRLNEMTEFVNNENKLYFTFRVIMCVCYLSAYTYFSTVVPIYFNSYLHFGLGLSDEASCIGYKKCKFFCQFNI